jgi:hypothetical protein
MREDEGFIAWKLTPAGGPVRRRKGATEPAVCQASDGARVTSPAEPYPPLKQPARLAKEVPLAIGTQHYSAFARTTLPVLFAPRQSQVLPHRRDSRPWSQPDRRAHSSASLKFSVSRFGAASGNQCRTSSLPGASGKQQLQNNSDVAIRTSRKCGCGSMVERGLPKPETRVRFPSPAPLSIKDLHSCAGKVQED